MSDMRDWGPGEGTWTSEERGISRRERFVLVALRAAANGVGLQGRTPALYLETVANGIVALADATIAEMDRTAKS